jgi:hypothetical protein
MTHESPTMDKISSEDIKSMYLNKFGTGIYKNDALRIVKNFLVPSKFHLLVKAVEDSKYMLEFEDNWDAEGAKAYQLETWERVIEQLFNLYQKTYELFQVVLPAPNIYAGVDGSIDVLWEERTYKVLSNFPENVAELASFYGETIPARETFEGTFSQTQSGCNLLSILVGMEQCTR